MWRKLCLIVGALGALLSGPACTGPTGPQIEFAGETFYLQYSEGNEQGWLNEYLPAGETFSSYQQMLAIRSYEGLSASPQEAGSSVIYQLLQDYPNASYSFFPGENGDAGLHFILSQQDMVEFNLFRFTQHQGHPFAIQFVYRMYSSPEDIEQTKQLMMRYANAHLTEWIVEIMSLPVKDPIRTPKQQRG